MPAKGPRTLRVGAASDGYGTRDLFVNTPPQCAGSVYPPSWNPLDSEQIVMACMDGSKHFGLFMFTVGGQLVRTYELGRPQDGRPDVLARRAHPRLLGLDDHHTRRWRDLHDERRRHR